MKSKTDLFLWANNIDGIKRELEVELFLFNKNYTPYSLNIVEGLEQVVKPLFLYDVIGFVTMGAGTGLAVKDYDSESEPNVVLRQDIEEVGRLETLLHIIENERHDILEFQEDEHDIKRQKGIVAKFTPPQGEPFYIFKALPTTKFLAGASAWNIVGGKAAQLVGSALSVPSENHVLVVDSDVFVFAQSKFETLFNYNYRLSKLAREKGELIDKLFKVNAAGTIEQGIEFLAAGVKQLHKRLADIDPELMTLEQLRDTAEQYQTDLMFDDDGGVILMDENDVRTFLDILEDNFVQGSIGKAYVANKKKELEL